LTLERDNIEQLKKGSIRGEGAEARKLNAVITGCPEV